MNEPTITVMGEEEPIDIGFSTVAAYHGQSALAMAAVVFQAQRAAFALLALEHPPARTDISIVSGHPGPGVRDSFEAVTRAVTRGAYVVDRSRSAARFIPDRDLSYSFAIKVGARSIDVTLRPGILPERFFTLVSASSRTADEAKELSALKRSIAETVLAAEPSSLFLLQEG